MVMLHMQGAELFHCPRCARTGMTGKRIRKYRVFDENRDHSRIVCNLCFEELEERNPGKSLDDGLVLFAHEKN